MIGGRHSEDIRALQEAAAIGAARLDAVLPQVEALQGQNASLSSQMAALSLQIAAELERSAGGAAEVAVLQASLAEMERVVAAQAELLRAQAAAIDLLSGRIERQEEAGRQVRGALARIDRQAAIDLDEMRRTSAATARAVLLRSFPPARAGDQVARADDS